VFLFYPLPLYQKEKTPLKTQKNTKKQTPKKVYTKKTPLRALQQNPLPVNSATSPYIVLVFFLVFGI